MQKGSEQDCDQKMNFNKKGVSVVQPHGITAELPTSTELRYRTFPSLQQLLMMSCSALPTYFPPSPPIFVALDNHQSVFHFCRSFISIMLYRQNHKVCHLLRLGFHFRHLPVELHAVCCISLIKCYYFLWLNSTPWYRCTTV